MQVLTDPLKIHDAGQAARHVDGAKALFKRDPQTGSRGGSKALRRQYAELIRLYTIPDAMWLPKGGAL